MAIRAKMFVEYKKEMSWGTEVALRCVTRGEDNKEWTAATPAGTFVSTIKNELAAEQFVVGREYFVDFTPVPEALEGQEGMSV